MIGFWQCLGIASPVLLEVAILVPTQAICSPCPALGLPSGYPQFKPPITFQGYWFPRSDPVDLDPAQLPLHVFVVGEVITIPLDKEPVTLPLLNFQSGKGAKSLQNPQVDLFSSGT